MVSQEESSSDFPSMRMNDSIRMTLINNAVFLKLFFEEH